LNLFFLRTRLGQQLRAMGQDAKSATRDSGERNRILATILSTVFASWGQLLFLQNIGTSTPTARTSRSECSRSPHSWCRVRPSPAPPCSGPDRQRCSSTRWFVVAAGGQGAARDAQIGEYFRVFVAYAVITVALVLHAWQTRRAGRAEG